MKKEDPRLAELRKTHVLDFYTFGERLSPTTEDAIFAAPPPHAEATRLREALAQLRARYDGRDLAGVIVISDGIDNGRLGHAELRPRRGRFSEVAHAPVHAAFVGKPGLHDVAIAGVGADDFAFVRNALQIEATIRVLGASDAGWSDKVLPVTLRRDGVPVKTVDVQLEEGTTDYHVSFGFTPERVEIRVRDLDPGARRRGHRREQLPRVV